MSTSAATADNQYNDVLSVGLRIGTLTLLDDNYSIIGVHLFGNSAGASLADSTTTPLVWPDNGWTGDQNG